MTLLAALDSAIAMAEFALDGTLMHANKRYRALLGIRPEDEGKVHHRDFCLAGHAESEDYKNFWERLTRGCEANGLFEHHRINGRHCWLEASYAPLRDKNGSVQGIVKVASDVTAHVQRETALNEQRRLLALVADTTDNAVLIQDSNGRIIYINAAFSRMFEFSSDDALGQAVGDLLIPYRTREEDEAVRQTLRNGQSLRTETLLHGKGNIRYWCNMMSSPVVDVSGNLLKAVTIITDITHAKLHEVLQQRVLEAMARDRPLAEVLSLVCQEVERLAPAAIASILEVDDQLVLHPLAAPSLCDEFSKTIDGVAIGPSVGSCGTAAYRDEPVAVADIATDPLWSPEGRRLALAHGLRACWSTPIHATDGRVIGTFALYYHEPGLPMPLHQELINASVNLCALALERERSRKRIRQLAFYDALTGLPNRHLLHAKIDQVIASAPAGSSIATLFLDIDRFKQINDLFGQPAGDALLRTVADVLHDELVAPDFAGRLAGDEFIVVLTESSREQAAEIVDRLLLRLAVAHPVGQASLSISACIGVAMYPADGRDTQTLLHRADLAMYHAKTNGRGRASFFNSEMNALAQERLSLEMALRRAVQTESLKLHYQPQINLKTGEIHGVEALARWHDAEHGNVPPSRFIPLAEECGLIDDLGQWALREACSQLALWRAHGKRVPSISVNLSSPSFHNSCLPNMISATLAQNGLESSDLTLEITESILLDGDPRTLETLDEVHRLGVQLSMDDFGTGYSSLSYLRRIPVSELKLDKSFVAELGKDKDQDATALALSDAVLRIGESLHLTVIAEGVETDNQRCLLAQQGYHVAQGYLFARPLPPEEFEAWMDKAMTVTTGLSASI